MADVNSPEQTSQAPAVSDVAEHLVPVEQIEPNSNQPRRKFEQTALDELAASMREKGVIQPLILRRHPSIDGKYQIVAGERRWRAAQLASLHDVPAIVRDYSETEVLEIAIIENIQREELNAIEEASGYRQLMDRFGHTQERIGEALGKSRSHIANVLRLLNLPDEVQGHVRDGLLSAGHARALVTSEDPVKLAKQIIKKGLSVREAEKLAKDDNNRPGTSERPPKKRDPDTVALENDLSAAIGLKVRIDHQSGAESGKISVDYPTLDDLDRLCGLLSSTR